MRYVFDDVGPTILPNAESKPSARYSAELRRELSQRNIAWARENRFAHELSLGTVPAVLYRKDDKSCHGNFYLSAYPRILKNPAWHRRLGKVHTSARKILLSRDADRSELDSSNSSDALLMSIFCHPHTLQRSGRLPALLGIDTEAQPVFGYRPRIPLKNGRADTTEIDLRLGSLLMEAKLTEYDFQTAPWRLVERYRDCEEVFDLEELPRSGDSALSYQLVRGVLAAYAEPDARFCVVCDARRPDLIASWYRILQCVRCPGLRCRLMLVTWQEIRAACPLQLQQWLQKKYGIE
jgi:hypothetical protein